MPPIDPPITQNTFIDAQMVEQHGLRAHHVGHRDHREAEAVGFARSPGRGRWGPVVPMQPPTTLAQSTKKRSVSMVRPGPTIEVPPPRLAGDGMSLGDVLVTGQRMTDQHHVGALGVEVGHRSGRRCGERTERDAAVELERHVASEHSAKGRRGVRARRRSRGWRRQRCLVGCHGRKIGADRRRAASRP